MIRVISKPAPVTYQGTCSKCKTVIECDEVDVQSYCDRDSGNKIEYKVKCPTCDNPWLWVKPKV